jgi:hypothetical protein
LGHGKQIRPICHADQLGGGQPDKDRADDHVESIGSSQPAQEQPLGASGKPSDRDRCEQIDQGIGQSKQAEQEEAEISAQHDQCAMGEIYGPGRLVYDNDPERRERINCPDLQASQQESRQLLHSAFRSFAERRSLLYFTTCQRPFTISSEL